MKKHTSLWDYIKEREMIRLRRMAGKPWPWTNDVVLQEGKFTNVQRERDRTSQEFHSVFSHRYQTSTSEVLLLNCAIARWFGTAEFYHSVGWQTGLNDHALRDAARARMEAGKPVFTRAYVITNGGQTIPKVDYVVGQVLVDVWARASEVVVAINAHRTWKAGYDVLRKCEGHGGTGFMAKEVLLDYITYVPALVDRDTWTPVGPGALRGLGRLLFADPYRKPQYPLDEVRNLWEALAPKWRKAFPDARPLSCHDVQFCLCEYDKYLRVRLGEGKMKNKYERRTK